MVRFVIDRYDDEDQLKLYRWSFTYMDDYSTVFLDGYYEGSRKTRRHKFVEDASYARIDTRGSTLKLADVPLPEFIKQEAHRKFIEAMRLVEVKKWDRK